MKNKIAFILSLTLFPAAAFAMQEKIDFGKATGSTVFRATGRPSALKINGTGTAPKGTLTWGKDGKVRGELIMDVASFDTGIEMRTRHMKESYLEVAKYPQSKLTLTEVSLPQGKVGQNFVAENVPFKGNLTLHGVTKPVIGTARIEQRGKSAIVHAEFPVKISDYAIPVPVFAGITVADDVALTIDATAPIATQ